MPKDKVIMRIQKIAERVAKHLQCKNPLVFENYEDLAGEIVRILTVESASNTSSQLLKQSEAVEITGMSSAWFERARWAGNGPPYIKMPGRAGSIRYDRDELLAWFADRRQTSTSQQ